ncbi:MAG: O-antigen ligase family protein [Anaerolineae bacterium]|nr:O-antigen ligase family protein [Anaerolineae bacterium]
MYARGLGGLNVRRRLRDRPWLQLGLTVAVALCCALLGAWSWWRGRSQIPLDAAPLSDPLANLNQVGVNLDLGDAAPEAIDALLAPLRPAGVRWVRQRFPWNAIERQPGMLDWARWDAIVAACAAHDLRLIAVLDGAPSWARPNAASDDPLAPPQETSDWGDFAARVARRYRGQIAAYQVWDEPNLAAHWGGRYVDPVAYTRLLREGAIRIREADPGAPILLAALAPTLETGPLNLNEIDYLRGVLAAGGAPFFDVVAVQPYGFAAPPDARPRADVLNFRRVELVRGELVRQGMADRPLWAVAGGWHHLPPTWQGDPSPWPSVTREQQAAYTADALRLAREEWPWMGPIVMYALQPNADPSDPRTGFALRDAEGAPTPAFEGLSATPAAPPALHVGTYVPGPDTAQISGDWRFAASGADPPRGAAIEHKNAVLSFDLHAAALDLTVRRGDYWGVLYVSIDGQAVNGLPRDEEGRSYLVLYDPAGGEKRVTVARGLATRSAHRVEIVAHGGWGQWPIVNWVAYGALAPSSGGAAAWALGALALAATLAAGAQLASVPALHDPTYRAIGRLFRWYRALPEWIPVAATLVTALLWYVSPWSAVALPLLALLFLLVFLRIDLGLALVACALPFYLRPKAMFGRPFSVIEVGLAICLAAWLLARALDLGRDWRQGAAQPLAWRLQRLDAQLRGAPLRLWRTWAWLDKGVLALLLVALLSLNWTAHRPVAYRELRTLFLEGAIYYALLRLAVRSPRARQRVVEGWLLGAVAISGVGIAQLIAGVDLITAEGVWRVRGLYGSPNNLALYVSRALPVLLAIAWQGRQREARIAYGLAALPVVAALVMTLSKGALLIGVPAALLALGLVQRNRRATWAALAAVAAIGLLVLPFAFTERFRSVLNLRAGTAFFRLKLWRSTVAMIADHPLTGVGMDNYLYAYRSWYVLPSAWEELDLSHPHNLILDAWTRLGLPGLIVVGGLFYAALRTVLQQLRTAYGDRRALLLGLFSVLVAILAHGMVDQAIYTPDLFLVFALILAMAGPPR